MRERALRPLAAEQFIAFRTRGEKGALAVFVNVADARLCVRERRAIGGNGEFLVVGGAVDYDPEPCHIHPDACASHEYIKAARGTINSRGCEGNELFSVGVTGEVGWCCPNSRNCHSKTNKGAIPRTE